MYVYIYMGNIGIDLRFHLKKEGKKKTKNKKNKKKNNKIDAIRISFSISLARCVTTITRVKIYIDSK